MNGRFIFPSNSMEAMMIPTFVECGPPIVDADIVRVESDIGQRLPEAYRLFLLNTNGGRAIPMSFIANLPKGQRLACAERFYTVNSLVRGSDLHVIYRIFAETITEDMLPIASTGTPCSICLSLYPRSYGSVWYYDYYAGFTIKPHPVRLSDRLFHYLYPDFSTFLESFTEEEPQ